MWTSSLCSGEEGGHEWNTERCCFSPLMALLVMDETAPSLFLKAAQQHTVVSWGVYFSHQHKGCRLDLMRIITSHMLVYTRRRI